MIYTRYTHQKLPVIALTIRKIHAFPPNRIYFSKRGKIRRKDLPSRTSYVESSQWITRKYERDTHGVR